MEVPIIVKTFHADEFARLPFAELQSESWKVIDHANSSDRKWLGSHCFWAARNNRVVVSIPQN